MTEHDEQHIIAKQPTLLERLRLTDPEAAQAIERLKRERQEMIVERDDCLEELAEARAEIERKNEALRRIADANVLDMNTLHPDGIQQEAREALAAPAPSTGEAYQFFAGMKIAVDYSLPPHVVEFRHAGGRVDRFRLTAQQQEPSTSKVESCTVRWCKSGLPATRRATDCHDDGAWNVAICQQCFDAFDLGKDGEDLPGPEEARRLLRAAQQQESGE